MQSQLTEYEFWGVLGLALGMDELSGLGAHADQRGQSPVLSKEGSGTLTDSPLEWVEVELRADPTLVSKSQLHSPTPPISKTPLALFNLNALGPWTL